jgi:hypothetical protein
MTDPQYRNLVQKPRKGIAPIILLEYLVKIVSQNAFFVIDTIAGITAQLTTATTKDGRSTTTDHPS